MLIILNLSIRILNFILIHVAHFIFINGILIIDTQFDNMAQPILDAIEALQSECTYSEIIYLTPDGEPLKQARVNQLSISGNLLIICGHYKGIDQRLRDHVVTLELSIGDYVLSGGELAAAVLTDAIVRLLPGAIGDEQSALTDSFQDELLAPPVYTRPANYNGWEVPEILRSGDHAAIEKWMEEQAYERTKARRPDLLKKDS